MSAPRSQDGAAQQADGTTLDPSPSQGNVEPTTARPASHHVRVVSPTGAVLEGRRGSALAAEIIGMSERAIAGAGDDVLKSPWVAPDKDKVRTAIVSATSTFTELNMLYTQAQAKEYATSLLFDRGMAPLWSTGLSQLDVLGPGIGLHFRLLRTLVVFFAISTIMVIPVLVLNYAGTRLEEEELDPLGVARISIANAAEPTKNYSTSLIRGSGATSRIISYTAREIANVTTACDILYCVAFLVVMAYFHHVVRTTGQRIADAIPSARSYAVMVTGLPKDTTEQELYQHFNSLYALDKPDWTYASSCKRCCWYGRKLRRRAQYTPDGVIDSARGWGKPQSTRKSDRDMPISANDHDEGVSVEEVPPPMRDALAIVAADAAAPCWARSGGDAYKLAVNTADAARQRVTRGIRGLQTDDVYPVIDTTYNGDPSFMNSWVADVSLARANGSLIRRYQALTGLFLRIQQARAEVRRYHTLGKPRQQVSAMDRLNKIEEQLDVIDRKYGKAWSPDVVAAFITFNNEESAARCVKDYCGSTAWWDLAYWFQPLCLQLRGTNPLRVKRAPDPSQIVWQNLEVRWWDRLLRRVGMCFLIAAILVISLVFIMVAQAYQVSFRARIPNLSLCSTVVPAIAFNRTVSPDGALAANVSLPAGIAFLRETNDICAASGKERLYWTSTDGSMAITSVNSSSPCLNECFSKSNAGMCVWPATSGNITLQRDTLLACYCYRTLREAISATGIISGARSVLSSDGKFCSQVALDWLTFNAFIVVASFVVIFINTLFANVLPYLGALEGHASIDAVQRSGSLFLFLGMFLNTALLSLIINAALPTGISALQVGSTRVFNGRYASFDVRWHTAVGAGIVLTMIINILSPHWWPMFVGMVWTPLTKRCCMGGAATQAELNQRVAPWDFQFPTRTAVVMNTVFVCLMYSTGHPILLPVAAMSLAICYVIDKYALLRVYRRPPRYDTSMAQFAVDLMPIGLIVHLAVAVWMVSDPLVLYSPDISEGDNDGSNAVLASAQAAEDAIGRYILPATENKLGTDVGRRLRRENTVPLFFLLVLVVTGYFLAQTAQTIFMRPARALFQALCATCPRLGRHRKLHNPPYTGPYAFPLDAKRGAVLSSYEERGGWRLGRDELGQLVRFRVWPTAGTTFTVQHARGERMRTWQVIAHAGIASYDIAANPLYAPAVRAIEAAKEKSEADAALTRGEVYIPRLPRVKSVVAASATSLPNALGTRDAGHLRGMSLGTGPRRGIAASPLPAASAVARSTLAAASNPLHIKSPAASVLSCHAGGPVASEDIHVHESADDATASDARAPDGALSTISAPPTQEAAAPAASPTVADSSVAAGASRRRSSTVRVAILTPSEEAEAGNNDAGNVAVAPRRCDALSPGSAAVAAEASAAIELERQAVLANVGMYHATMRQILGFDAGGGAVDALEPAAAYAVSDEVERWMLAPPPRMAAKNGVGSGIKKASIATLGFVGDAAPINDALAVRGRIIARTQASAKVNPVATAVSPSYSPPPSPGAADAAPSSVHRLDAVSAAAGGARASAGTRAEARLADTDTSVAGTHGEPVAAWPSPQRLPGRMSFARVAQASPLREDDAVDTSGAQSARENPHCTRHVVVHVPADIPDNVGARNEFADVDGCYEEEEGVGSPQVSAYRGAVGARHAMADIDGRYEDFDE